MPWSNVPKGLENKMERCVEAVMKSGKNNKAAIAICYTQVVGRKVSDEARKRTRR